MARHSTFWGAVLCTAALLCNCSRGQRADAQAALSTSTSSSSAPGSQAPGAGSVPGNDSTPSQNPQSVPSDPGAQIDQLMKQCNEAINIKVQFQRAEELARQALDLSEKAGDKGRAAMAMVFLSAALGYQGRLSEALEVAQKTVPVARESGDKKALEQALNSAGSVTGGLGRYEEALGYFYECLNLAREINDPTMQYMSLLNIGEAYVRSEDPGKAELPLQESLRIARELKPSLPASNPSKKATEMALLNLGAMEMARHHYRAALNYYEQVHRSKPESSLWVVSALQGMASAYEQLGEPQKAIEFLDRAIPIAEKAASGVEYRSLLSALGVNQEKLGNLDAALASEDRALTLIHEAGGDPDTEWQVESRIAHIERALGNNDQALDHYRKSISGIEQLRSVALNTEEGRAGVLARSRETYAEAADLLYDLHRESEALAMAERGRARAFLDLLAETRIGAADELTPEQRKRGEEIQGRISAAQKDLWKSNISAEEKKKIEVRINSAEADLEELHLAIRQSNPQYAGIHYPEPLSAGEIRERLLGDRTALIEYLLGEKRSLAWVVTKKKTVVAVLPARKDIEEQVFAYRKLFGQQVSALTAQQSLKEISRAGARLYASVFAPVESSVAGSRKMIIVPDGELDYLPFESLVTGHAKGRPRYLAETFVVVYGASASALVTVQALNRESTSAPKALLAFGDPAIAYAGSPAEKKTANGPEVREVSPEEDYTERGFSFAPLPYTRDEVLAIGRLFAAPQRTVYLGGDASEEAVKRAKLDDYRFIHFATHSFLDEAKPGRSGILLSRSPQSSEDGILQVDEIMRLKLNADLVTLSACSTGLGKLVNGEGILGLTRAFFYAGARNVAVSLWNVNDSATATLMASFYRNLNRGLSTSSAMRQAKLALLNSPHTVWQHPYFWAPFVLEGEGR